MSSEREGLRTSNLVHRRSTKSHITDKRRDLQGQSLKGDDVTIPSWISILGHKLGIDHIMQHMKHVR